jgi:hypothetical protein
MAGIEGTNAPRSLHRETAMIPPEVPAGVPDGAVPTVSLITVRQQI